MRRGIAVLLVTALAAMVLFVCVVGAQLVRAVPADVGEAPDDLRAIDIVFPSESGSVIHGWFVEGEGERGCMLLLPGIRANRLSMVERARFLRRLGYGVMLIDFQATGESPGRRITFGSLESRDVAAAVARLRELCPNQPVGVIGSSLGGAAALLTRKPIDADALVLEAVYPTIRHATSNRLRQRLGFLAEPMAGVLLMPLRLGLGVAPNDLQPIDRIGEVQYPKFIISGAADRHTTADDTRALFEAAQEPKSIWLVPELQHVDIHRARRVEYERRVSDFIASAFETRRARDPAMR